MDNFFSTLNQSYDQMSSPHIIQCLLLKKNIYLPIINNFVFIFNEEKCVRQHEISIEINETKNKFEDVELVNK